MVEQPRYCTSCGRRVNQGYRYCTWCSEPISPVDNISGVVGQPGTEQPKEPPVPVQLEVDYPESLSRGLLLIKWLLAIPLYIFVALYGLAAFIVTFIAFWIILLIGRYPEGMFNFVRGYLSTSFRVLAYFPYLLCDSWLPVQGHALRYQVEYPSRLSRLALIFLKLPSFIFSIAFSLTSLVHVFLLVFAIPMWFVLLVTGRYPRKLFAFNVSVLQWVARVDSWQFLMRDDRSLFGTTRPVQWAVGISVVLLVLSLWSPVSLPGVQTLGNALVDSVGTFVPAKRDGEIILRQFMEAGQRNDVQGATALVTQEDTTRSQLEQLFSVRFLFQDHEAIRTSGWNWEKGTAGETLELEGRISYATGEDGVFYALLVKDEGDWKIESLRLDRP